MALTGQSSFTGTPDTTWKPKTAETDSQGFTMAQRRMEGARSPLNGNMENEVKPKEDPGVTTESSRAQATAGEEAKKNKPGDMQPNPLLQEAQRVGQQIGNLGYNLQASLNTLLHGATTNIGSAGEVGYTVDSTTGEVAMSPDSLSNVYDPVVQQKLQEQKQLKESLTPFSNGDQTKDFGQVLREQNEGKNTAMLMQLVESLKEYEQNGAADSPEARAMRAQLKAMDKDGLVSGLYAARNRYNKLMGQKVYGDEGDVGYDVHELSTMDTSKIEDEVQKAAEFSSGLFGGDFETSLAKMYDDQSAARQASGIREATVRNKLSSALKLILEDTASSLGKNRAAFRQALLDGSDEIVAALNKAGNTEAAQAYLSATNAGKAPDEVLYEIMSNPEYGIQKDLINNINRYIGDAATDTKAEFATYLSQLATNGYFNVPDANGKERKVRPTAQQQLEIIRQAEIMNNATTQEEKDTAQAKISEIINNLQIDPSTTLSGFVSDLIAKTTVKPEVLSKEIEAASERLTTMLTTFANSQFEQEMANVLGLNTEEWGKMTEAQRAAAVNALYASDPKKFRDLESKIMNSINAAKIQVDATAKGTENKLIEGLGQVDKNIENMESVKLDAGTQLKNIFSTLESGALNTLRGASDPNTLSKITNNLSARSDLASAMGTHINGVPKVSAQQVGNLAKIYAYYDAFDRVKKTFPAFVNDYNVPTPITIAEFIQDPTKIDMYMKMYTDAFKGLEGAASEPTKSEQRYQAFLKGGPGYKLPPGVGANRDNLVKAISESDRIIADNNAKKVKIENAQTNLNTIREKVFALGDGFNFNEVVKKAITSPEWATVTMGGGISPAQDPMALPTLGEQHNPETYNTEDWANLQGEGIVGENQQFDTNINTKDVNWGAMGKDFGGAVAQTPGSSPATAGKIVAKERNEQGRDLPARATSAPKATSAQKTQRDVDILKKSKSSDLADNETGVA